MQTGEAVSKPRDAVRLAASSGVLNEVVAARSFCTGSLDESLDGIELMVAREHHRLTFHRAQAPAIFNLLLAGFEKDVGA